MIFTHTINPRAQKEYETSLEWYLDKSHLAGENFVLAINETINIICENPEFGKNYYNAFFEMSLNVYPFKIIYLIEKDVTNIVIFSFFHNKRNPIDKYLI